MGERKENRNRGEDVVPGAQCRSTTAGSAGVQVLPIDGTVTAHGRTPSKPGERNPVVGGSRTVANSQSSGFMDTSGETQRLESEKKRSAWECLGTLERRVSPGLYLDEGAERKAAGRKGASCRPVLAEGPDVGLVHDPVVVDVGEQDGRLHDVSQAGAFSLEKLGDVGDGLPGLRTDTAGDELPLGGAAQLAGDYEEVTRPHYWRVGPHRWHAGFL